ncbi:MAG TPA: ferritin-like domain-containing protein [Candidatus Eisenbacteria bacterium]|nr:ferritin-like domain-containing protein [Candidatus Eisenbacteria bacterium]
MAKKKSARGGKHTSGRRSSTGHQKRPSNGRTQSHMVENLEEGFLAEVADLLHAERQIVKALPKFAESATSRRLRETFEDHLEQTEDQVVRLERIFQLFERKPQVEVCEGMQGILSEGKEVLHKTGPGPVRDAMMIAAAQKVEHYEITSYGTLCSWAEQLGEREALELLDQTLREEKEADRKLSRIAESFANQQAEGRIRGESEGWRNRDYERSRGDRYDDERDERPRSSTRGRQFISDDDQDFEPRFGERTRARGGRG